MESGVESSFATSNEWIIMANLRRTLHWPPATVLEGLILPHMFQLSGFSLSLSLEDGSRRQMGAGWLAVGPEEKEGA